MPLIDKTFVAEYDLLDVTAANDASCITDYNQDFADINLLPFGSEFINYATFEKNFFLLDGSLAIMPEIPSNIAFYSNTLSNVDGTFDENPFIDIQFTKQHSTVALTMNFIDVHPLEIAVKFFTLSNTLLNSKTVKVTSNEFILELPVTNYGKIRIEFLKTLPNHFIKINKLEFGRRFVWDETNIISANLVEEKSLITETIAINTLNFEVYDPEDMYNLGNPEGFHKYIQKGQYLKPYEIINGNKLYLGDYYVNKFSISQNSVKFNCFATEGNMDSFTFYKGCVYEGELAGVIIESIFHACGITNYEIDEATYNHKIYGAIPPMTCREAMSKVLFACNSTLDSSRTSLVRICKSNRAIAGKIGVDRKISTKITRADYISGVKLSYKSYSLQEDVSEILKDTFSTGTHLIQFDSPAKNITTSLGSIVEAGDFYCILKVDEPGEVILSGNEYKKSDLYKTVSVSNIESGEISNIKEFSDVLVNNITAEELGKLLLEYYSFRLKIDIQYLADYEDVSSWYNVQNPQTQYDDFVGGMESITTDLTGGFVATAKLVGYYDTSSKSYYCGNEIYANNDFII